jgi:hypothetical protein
VTEVKYIVECHYISEFSDCWLHSYGCDADTMENAETRWKATGSTCAYRIVEIRTVRTVVKEST